MGAAAAGPSMVRAAPRVGARLAARWCTALARKSVRWRALDRRHGTLRGPAFARAMVPSVDQAFLRSICWPVHAVYREAKRSGDSAAMLRIRLEVQRERAEWAQRWGSTVS